MTHFIDNGREFLVYASAAQWPKAVISWSMVRGILVTVCRIQTRVNGRQTRRTGCRAGKCAERLCGNRSLEESRRHTKQQGRRELQC